MSAERIEKIVECIAELERIGTRVIAPPEVIDEVMDLEDAAAGLIDTGFFGIGPQIPKGLRERVDDLADRYLGFVGEDEGADERAARLFAFETFHHPEHRPNSVVPRFDMTGWPFNCIDWAAATAGLHADGAFGRDIFVVRGHAFHRAVTFDEGVALVDDWVR